jgi:hypothetical protein
MTIAAILDLDTALATFKQTAQALLQPTEMNQWDGPHLQAQEQQIRQAALELAGHCVAMLLHQLSQDLSAQEQAQQRTESSRGFGSQSQGNQQVRALHN